MRLPRSLASAIGRAKMNWEAAAANTTAPRAASLMWNDFWMSGASSPNPLSIVSVTSAARVKRLTPAIPCCRRMGSIGGGLPSPVPGMSWRSATDSATPAPPCAIASESSSSGTAKSSSGWSSALTG